MPKKFYIDTQRFGLPTGLRLYRRTDAHSATIYAVLPKNGSGSEKREVSTGVSGIGRAAREAVRLHDERLARRSQDLPEDAVSVRQIFELVVKPSLRSSNKRQDRDKLRHWVKFIIPKLGELTADKVGHDELVAVTVFYVLRSVKTAKNLKAKGKRGSFRIKENGLSVATVEKFLASVRFGWKKAAQAKLVSAPISISSSEIITSAREELVGVEIYDRDSAKKRLKLYQDDAAKLKDTHNRLKALLSLEVLRPALKDPSKPHQEFSNKYLSQRFIRSRRISAHKPFSDLSKYELNEELTRSNSRWRFAITSFLIELTVGTGIRPQEAKLLRFSDFQLVGTELTINIREEVGKKRFERGENRNARLVVPRNDAGLIAALASFRDEWLFRHNRQPKPSDLLFQSARFGKKNEPQSLHQTFCFALRTLGFETVVESESNTNQILSLYTLRSLYITELRDAGVADRLIAKNAGTSTAMISAHYDAFDIRDHRATLRVPIQPQNNVEIENETARLSSH
jgi:integrase